MINQQQWWIAVGRLSHLWKKLKNAHVKHFEKVLANRPVKSGIEKHQKLREELCIKRIKNAKLNKTPDWDIKYVKFVIKEIKEKDVL